VPFVEGPGGVYIGIDDGDGTLANATSGDFCNVWMLMTAVGYQFLLPQAEFASEALADAEEFTSLTLTGLPVAEFVARAKITYEAKSNYSDVTGSVELKSITPINIGAIPAASGSYDAAGTAAAAVALHEATYAHADIATALQPDDDAATMGSGEATNGHVLTADGTGGAAWEAVPAGEGGWDGDIADINLDGGTDIGADLADADLILVDDGGAGTNRKSALSRVRTYVRLAQSPQTITTADVTGAANTHYLCTIAGLTANRALTLPAGTAGDQLRVTILDGDPTYALELKGATDITINGGLDPGGNRFLAVAGQSITYEATSASNWQEIALCV
jgi:hypothetical protein